MISDENGSPEANYDAVSTTTDRPRATDQYVQPTAMPPVVKIAPRKG